MKKLCDLHTHSICSDGTWTPTRLIEEAERIGLGAIALTDHNTVSGLPEFLAAAKGREVEAVPGIEISADWQDKELHIVALYVRPEYFEQLEAMMAEGQRRKAQSNRDLIEALDKAGYHLDLDAMMAARPNDFLNRGHIAIELTRLGYTQSRTEAFEKLLRPEAGYYRPPKRIGAEECIRYIKSIGAVAVLAHPLLTLTEERLRQLLPEAAAWGLDAMETRYVTYDAATETLARRIAAEYGLKESGGSDFHAEIKPGIGLGCGRGDLEVPLELLEILKLSR